MSELRIDVVVSLPLESGMVANSVFVRSGEFTLEKAMRKAMLDIWRWKARLRLG